MSSSVAILALLLCYAGVSLAGPRFGCNKDKLAQNVSPADACDGPGYARSVATSGGPVVTIVVLILMIIYWLVFCFGRCCNCMGGRKNLPGVCCIHSDDPEKFYKKWEVIAVKALIVVACILALIALIVAGSSKKKISDGAQAPIQTVKGSAARVVDIFDQILSGVDKSLAAFNRIASKLNDSSVTNVISSANSARQPILDGRKTVSDINDPSTTTGKQLEDAKKSANDVQARIYMATVILTVIPFVILLVSTILAFVNLPDKGNSGHRWPFYICITLGTWLAWLIWILVFILTIVHILMTDLYDELEGADQAKSDAELRSNYPLMNEIRKRCRENLQEPMDKISDKTSEFDRIASEQFCKQLNSSNQGACGTFSCCTGLAKQKCPNLNCGTSGRHMYTMGGSQAVSFNDVEMDSRRYVDAAMAFVMDIYRVDLDVPRPSWREYLDQPSAKASYRLQEIKVPPSYAPSTVLPPGSPPQYAYLQNLTNQNITFSEILKVVGNLTIPTEISAKYGCSSPCTLAACATQCNDTKVKDVANVVLDMASGTGALYDVATDVILPLLNCPTIIYKLVYPARDDVKTMRLAVRALLDSLILSGVSLVLMIVANVFGIKRYTKKFIQGGVIDNGTEMATKNQITVQKDDI